MDAGVKGQLWKRHLTSSRDIYAFTRQSGNSQIVVIVNLSNEKLPLTFKNGNVPDVAGMSDYFGDKKAELPKTLNPWEYKVYVK